MIADLAAALVIYLVVAGALYWNLESRGVLPSNDHVRVLAVCWPVALLVEGSLGVAKLARHLTKATVVDTVIAFQRVGDWRYHNGKVLAPPKAVLSSDDRDRAAEVEKLLEEV